LYTHLSSKSDQRRRSSTTIIAAADDPTAAETTMENKGRRSFTIVRPMIHSMVCADRWEEIGGIVGGDDSIIAADDRRIEEGAS